MPDLTIDGRPVSVPEGTSVLEAAEKLGIMIPRFCWHKALGAVGACRMCAVMFLGDKSPGLAMSCMTPAADGMVVETFHPEAVAFRRHVIEWLMANHPHDCPVCDEGGHCLLQDETISGNHAIRRYPGRKRTYQDQDLGPFIQHEMNRCIHCYRCSRFYQEYAGYLDYGPMQIANRVYFGRFAPGRLESPFSGNIADICPTGTLTDKTARYKGRRWNMERAPSVCPHCSLGCNTVAAARHREMVRVEARENPAVNGFFLCDRGRFSHGFDGSPDRPRTARLDDHPAALDAALEAAAERLLQIALRHGPAAIAAVSSTRATLETQASLAHLCRAMGWLGPVHFPTAAASRDARAALAALAPNRARSLAAIESADMAVCLGVAPLYDAPMLALALRQAARKGAGVVLADPRPGTLPLPFTRLPASPRNLPAILEILTAAPDAAPGLAQKRLPLAPQLWPGLEAANKALAAAKRPVLAFAPSLAEVLPRDERIGLFPVLDGPNAAGAALLETGDPQSLEDVRDGVAAGRIKALVAAEADLYLLAPALAEILAQVELLVVLDHLPTPTVAAATIFAPSQTLFEAGGALVNNECRLQLAAPAHVCGEPVSRDGRGSHPPRAYDRPLPGTDPRPAWEILARLAANLDHPFPDAPLALARELSPSLAGLDAAAVPAQGLRLPPPPPVAIQDKPFAAQSGLAVVFTDALFGTEELGRYAPLAQSLAEPAAVWLHPDEARAMNLGEGHTAVIESGNRLVPVAVRLDASMARGVAAVPRLPEFAGVAPSLGPCGLRRK